MSIPPPDLMGPSAKADYRRSFPGTKAGRTERVERAVFPYGLWEIEDGRAVVFNRAYDPVFVVEPDGRVVPVVGGWVKARVVGARHFFSDGTRPWDSRRQHARVAELFCALNAAARATGYGQPPPRPGLIEWLRDRAAPPILDRDEAECAVPHPHGPHLAELPR